MAWLLGLLLCSAMPAWARLGGLPLMQQFSPADLPGAPSYSSGAVDAEGTLYVGSDDGIMVYRSGTWELVPLPRRAAVYSLLVTPDDRIFVAGVGAFGRLHRLDDGSFRFEDLLDGLREVLPGNAGRTFYGLAEAGGEVLFRNSTTLFGLRRDGNLWHAPVPVGMGQRVFSAGDVFYTTVAGVGLSRLLGGRTEPVPGAGTLRGTRIAGVWTHSGGLLVATGQGLYLAGRDGIAPLDTPADALLRRHPPYSSLRLRDGSLVFSAYDGTLIHVGADLQRVETFALGKDVAYGFTADPEGGLWVVADAGLTRLRLPSPWTVYDRRHGLEHRLFDFAYFDGALWVGSSSMLRAHTGDGGPARFESMDWSNRQSEVLALLATPGGLLIGDRDGLAVLEPAGTYPRRLLDADALGSITVLYPSPSTPGRVLVAGHGGAAWLLHQDGGWQVQARWKPEVGEYNGLFQWGEDEVWVGDRLGGVHRWRFDPASGVLLEQAHLGGGAGLHTDPELGTRLLLLDGALFAVSGTRVQRLRDGRFEAATLPELPGLERPWELAVVQTPLATFAWTSQQLWRRMPGQAGFQLLQTGTGRVPGYASVQLQADGQLRLLAREHILQFDPTLASEPEWRLRSRLDRVQLRHRDGSVALQPRQPGGGVVVPPGGALAIRFGLATMENDFEFRFRLGGQAAPWSEWSSDREVVLQRLPPGRYTLQYQGRIRGGPLAEPGRLQLQFKPFWYEYWWMRALFLLSVLAAVGGLFWLRNRGINQRNRELERKIAERTAELEQANRRLTELAVMDGLTGVANRRALERALERGWQLCADFHQPLALVMADVDYFKRYNDSHGHQAGDEQLRRVASLLAGTVHGVNELAARYGGEEFVLVLPGIDLDTAQRRAEDLRAQVQRSVEEGALGCTISLGVAVAYPPAGDPANLLGAADRALYRAKRDGRNCVRGADVQGLGGGAIEAEAEA